MDAESIFWIFMGLILFSYGVLFFGGRHYLREYFQTTEIPGPVLAPPGPKKRCEADDCPKDKMIPVEQLAGPYAQQPIMDVDDYEYSLVFREDSGRGISQELRNKLMSQYPMDWSGTPPESSTFQAGLRESFENAKPNVPDQPKAFEPVSGQNMVPPDTYTPEQAERKILQTYKPSTAGAASADGSATVYDAKDAERLIAKIYEAKGLVPTVVHQPDTNVYEIVGTREKGKEIQWEDEMDGSAAPASTGPVRKAGEATLSVPPTAMDVAAAKDPFYETNQNTRTGRWDYSAWTPGLERSFAPSNPLKNWY